MSKRVPLPLLRSERAAARSRFMGAAKIVRGRLAPKALAADAAEAVAMRTMLAVGKPGSTRRNRILAAGATAAAFAAAIGLRFWHARDVARKNREIEG